MFQRCGLQRVTDCCIHSFELRQHLLSCKMRVRVSAHRQKINLLLFRNWILLLLAETGSSWTMYWSKVALHLSALPCVISVFPKGQHGLFMRLAEACCQRYRMVALCCLTPLTLSPKKVRCMRSACQMGNWC